MSSPTWLRLLITLISIWSATALYLIEVGLPYLGSLQLRPRKNLISIIRYLIGVDLVTRLHLEVGLSESDLVALCGGGSGTMRAWVHVRYVGRLSYSVMPGSVFSVMSSCTFRVSLLTMLAP